jgi:hypothetical protein
MTLVRQQVVPDQAAHACGPRVPRGPSQRRGLPRGLGHRQRRLQHRHPQRHRPVGDETLRPRSGKPGRAGGSGGDVVAAPGLAKLAYGLCTAPATPRRRAERLSLLKRTTDANWRRRALRASSSPAPAGHRDALRTLSCCNELRIAASSFAAWKEPAAGTIGRVQFRLGVRRIC